MKISKQRLKEIIKEELGPWRDAFAKVPRGERLNPVESELIKLAAGLKRLGIGDDEVDDLLQPLTAAVEANVEGELGLEEAVLHYNPVTGTYGQRGKPRRQRTDADEERDRREREKQNEFYKSHRSKRGSVRGGAHLEEEDNQAQQRRDALVSPNAGGLSWRSDDRSEDIEYTGDIDQYSEPEEEECMPNGQPLRHPEEQLLSRILARAVVDKYDLPERDIGSPWCRNDCL